MSISIAQFYAKTLRDKFGFFVNWPPNREIEIGQYGVLDGALFNPLNILTGEDLKPSPPGSSASYNFSMHSKKEKIIDAEILADAGVAHGNVLLNISFEKKIGVSFSAPGGYVSSLTNLIALGQLLSIQYRANNWDINHGVIVEIIKVPKATIIISEQKGAFINFSIGADVPISEDHVANLNAETSFINEEGIGAKVIGQGPLTPLFRLAFLKPRLFKKDQVVVRGPGDEVPYTKKIQTPDGDELLVY